MVSPQICSRLFLRLRGNVYSPRLQYPNIRHISSHNPRAVSDEHAADIAAARRFIDNLRPDSLRHQVSSGAVISFSRSSGPGGQNVNKVSSKATVRIPTDSLLSHIPTLLHSSILGSRYHAAKSDHLVIQADDSRKQSDNVDACFRKLHDLVVDAGRDAVPGETSGEQAKHVQNLDWRAKMKKRKMKTAHSLKKTGRKGGSGDGY